MGKALEKYNIANRIEMIRQFYGSWTSEHADLLDWKRENV
jgi:hypothetical protein